ncbi:MAG: hypothetical protein V4484_11870 [Pseudomonadota bacterium]
MNITKIRRVLCLFLCVAALRAVAEDDPLVQLKKGQPKDVAILIERLVGCNHWSGEEPYDAGRKKEIASAMTNLKCDRLDADEAKALKRHANNPKAQEALRVAKKTSN